MGVLTVSNDYFEKLDLGLRRGRVFTDRDGTAGNQTAIVNRLFAETFFANEDPLGRRIRLPPRDEPADDAPWLTIVGVSPTVRQSFGAAPAIPVAYLPYRAEPLAFTQVLARDERQAAVSVAACVRPAQRAAGSIRWSRCVTTRPAARSTERRRARTTGRAGGRGHLRQRLACEGGRLDRFKGLPTRWSGTSSPSLTTAQAKRLKSITYELL